MHSLKYLFIITLISLFMLTSCIKDKYSVRKDMLLEFYAKIDKALNTNDQRWFEKNFYAHEKSKVDKNVIFDNTDSLKNFVLKDSQYEHSITFLYNSGFDQLSSHLGSAAIVVRDNRFQKKYYYIRMLFDENKNRWLIDEIIFGSF